MQSNVLVLSLISSTPAKTELSHYASTAQLLKCDKALETNQQ